MAKKIYMTNLKGGVGVTTCCLGLGIALASMGERTLIIDGDYYCGSGLIVGGVADMSTYTLSDYEKGACRAKQTIISHPKILNLHFVSSIGVSSADIFEKATKELDGLFDYIILDDTPNKNCDEGLIVTEPFAPSIKSADCARAKLFDSGVKNMGLIVNKLNGCHIINGEVMPAQEIASLLRLPLKAVIGEDLSIPLGKWKKSTMKAFKVSAETIMGRRQLIVNVLKDYFGLNGFIKRKLRERL